MIRKRAKFQEHKSCSNLSCTVHHSVQLNRTHTLSFHFKAWHSTRNFLFCGGDLNDNLPRSRRKSMMLRVSCLEVGNSVVYPSLQSVKLQQLQIQMLPKSNWPGVLTADYLDVFVVAHSLHFTQRSGTQ